MVVGSRRGADTASDSEHRSMRVRVNTAVQCSHTLCYCVCAPTTTTCGSLLGTPLYPSSKQSCWQQSTWSHSSHSRAVCCHCLLLLLLLTATHHLTSAVARLRGSADTWVEHVANGNNQQWRLRREAASAVCFAGRRRAAILSTAKN